MKTNLIKILFIICFITSLISEAKLRVVSLDQTQKIQWLKEMLESGSYPQIPPEGNVVIDPQTGVITFTGVPSTNYFGTTLKRIIEDTSDIKLLLEKSGVLGGAFNGPGAGFFDPANGTQSLDMNDFKEMPHVGNFGLGSWQIYLLHELYEQFIGWKYGLTYSPAHDSALAAESKEIFAIGGKNYMRVHDYVIGDTVYLTYKKNNNPNDTIQVKFYLNSDGQIDRVVYETISDFRTGYISGGCSSGLCGFFSGKNGIIYEPVPGTESIIGAEYMIKDRRGNIYASIPSQGKVKKFSYEGIVTIQYQHSSLSTPSGLAFNASTNELYVACSTQNNIVVFNGNGTYSRTISPQGLHMAAGLDLDINGNIFVSSHGSDTVLRMTPSGEIIGKIGNPLLHGPAGLIYIDEIGKLFVVSNTNNKILTFSRQGAFLGEFGTGASLNSPWGINSIGGKISGDESLGTFYQPFKCLAVANSGSNGIVVLNPDGTVKHTMTQPGFQPKAILMTYSVFSSPIGIKGISSEAPESFTLSQNYPNPFNPVTNIEFSIPKSSFVNLIVYDVLGREVETLVSKDLKAGTYKADWNASAYTSGIYFYKITANGYSETKRMALVK